MEYLSGVKAHTLRIWEQRYGIIAPKRTATNIRYYDDLDLRRILNISFLNQNGYKISKIAQLKEEEIHQLIEQISLTPADPDTHIGSLILAMVNLDERRFNQVIQLATHKDGFEHTALHVIFPFLERVGILWQTGDVNPAQEHFISGLIRQKLIAAIDSLPNLYHSYHQKYLLFLPEGEWHEIGLLFAYYLVKKRKHKAIYLGQSLPFSDLLNTVQLFEPDVIVCSITTQPAGNALIKFGAELLQHFPNRQLIMSGSQVLRVRDDLPAGIKVIDNIQQFVAHLEGESMT